MKILFLHGWRSVPGGVKPTFLAQHGHKVLNPRLPDEDFDQAVRIAQAEFDRHDPAVVVGSSRGGGVAMNIDSGNARLVLLCPAWKKWGTAKTIKPSTIILHSRADDAVPYAHSEELVKNSGLPVWALIEVGGDHRLADPESLDMLLEACLVDDDEPIEEPEKSILERDWTGLCYTAALRWAEDAEDQDWLVVTGKFGQRPGLLTVRRPEALHACRRADVG
jgi:Alpha/beta hydrolase family